MGGVAWPGGGGGLHLDADHPPVGRFADQIYLMPVAVPVPEQIKTDIRPTGLPPYLVHDEGLEHLTPGRIGGS